MSERTWVSSRARMGAAASTLALALFGVALPALAQVPATPPPARPGTLVVERIHSGFVFAPEVRVSEVDDRTGTLVGGYGGWLTDRTLLVGAGGYWLADGDGRELAYGGAIVEWALRGQRRLGFGVRGLVGVGRAELDTTFPDFLLDGNATVPRVFGQFGRRGDPSHGHPPPTRGGGATFVFRGEDTFFVLEPQVSVHWNATPWMRVNIGAGYRVIGGASWSFDERLRGPSGSFSLQFGGDGL